MRFALLLACAASLSSSACSGALDSNASFSFEDDPSLSSLRVPLTGQDAAGTVYRVRDVQIDLVGAALLSLSERDGIRVFESLVTDLPAGEYTAHVRSGWRLMERAATGTEVETPAELVSVDPIRISVHEMGNVTLRLEFKRGEEVLRLGAAATVHLTHSTPHSRNIGAQTDNTL